MVAFYVAATVVTLLQFLRVKERRLLVLLVLFAAQAAGESREWWDPWREGFELLAGSAGLALLVILSPRAPRHREDA